MESKVHAETFKLYDAAILLFTYMVSFYHILIGLGILMDGFSASPSFDTARDMLPSHIWGLWPFLCGVVILVSCPFFPRATAVVYAVAGGWGFVFGGSFWVSYFFDGGAITAGITYVFLAGPSATILAILWWKLGLKANKVKELQGLPNGID